MTNESIAGLIVRVQGRAVLFDADLAQVCSIPLSRLREMVERHPELFPGDLCFQPEPVDLLYEYRAPRPSAFTEQGAWMVALLSDDPGLRFTAIEISRAFNRDRQPSRAPDGTRWSETLLRGQYVSDGCDEPESVASTGSWDRGIAGRRLA